MSVVWLLSVALAYNIAALLHVCSKVYRGGREKKANSSKKQEEAEEAEAEAHHSILYHEQIEDISIGD